MTVTRQQVVAEARSWRETKWRHQGRNRQGIDCVGLPAMICHRLGISDYDWTNYDREPTAREMLPTLLAAGAVRIDPKDGKDGDLYLFHQAGFPCHVGIRATHEVYGVPSIIHAHAGHRKVVEEVLQDKVPLVAVMRLPGVVD